MIKMPTLQLQEESGDVPRFGPELHVRYWLTAVEPGENAAERHDCAPHQAVADPLRPLS
jgi:hypothetical protein